METEDEDTFVTLRIAIPVDPSKETESYSSYKKVPPGMSSDFTHATEIISERSLFYNLPYSLDPNLGIMGQLLSSNIEYGINTFNTWNIEPYFLHILPSSATSSCENSILVFGGLNPSSVLGKTSPDFDHKDFVLGSTIFQYLLNSGLWQYYGTMIEPRCYHTCVLEGQYVYITGGYSLLKREHGEMLAVSSTDRLNLNNKQWSRCASMVLARAAHAVVSHNGNLYAFGGRDSQGNILSSVEIYYPEQDMWSEITSLPRPCMGLSATCIKDTIWLMGGITLTNSADPSNCLLSTVYSFIPNSNRWCLEEELPYGCAYSSCISSNDSLWLIGGCIFKDSKADSLVSCPTVLQLILSKIPSKWKQVTSLLSPRHALTAVLYDKCIYVLAGIESDNNCSSNKMEVINTTTNICSKCTNIPVSITGCASVLILEENYLHMKWDKNNVYGSNVSLCENYLNSAKKGGYISETDKTFSPPENVCQENRSRHTSSTFNKIHEESEICKEIIVQKTELEASDDKSIEETIGHQEYNNKRGIFCSYPESNVEKVKNDQNLKYRASMEFFINANGHDNESSYALLRKKSSASKWLSFFHILSASDEELHKETSQSNEPKLNVKTEISDSESQENFKSAEVKYFEKEKKLDFRNKYYNSTNIQGSLPSDDKSFVYVQSNLKTEMLNKALDTKKMEESHESISDLKSAKLEMDLLPMPSDTDKIAVDEESFPIILLMGGECRGNSKKSKYILSYDCGKEIWKHVGYMPDYRCHHSVVILNNKIYVIGGFDSKNSRFYENITKKVLCYNICEKKWQYVAEMSYSRAFHSAFVLKNEIHVLGGRNQLGEILSAVEVYNESLNEWRESKSSPYPVLGTAASIVNGLLYIFGGITYEDKNEIISCRTTIFDPEYNSWSVGPDLPVPLAFCGISNSSKNVWLFGGLKEEKGNIISGKDIFQFYVPTEIWSKVGELSIPRHASVTVSLGEIVYVIGGHSTQVKKEVLTCEKIDVLKNEVMIQESLPIAVSGRAGIVVTEASKTDTEIN